ncbi:uncharacterized protein LOC106157457 [Lingula anatina]|uniref:Uncharacterized protein LOC106157457 n=1 Tax=Lingula anatina TaxID=7574 RepID=A0A1S3HRB5_LINAN|nr:uncharacterized protein LOC106157457 [Lingula anatina]|eukprot:XP_013388573.1 uncharacterized protein LOC106157457 [Lingula anatina]
MAHKNKKTRYPCGTCQRACSSDAIECSSCLKWIHRECVPMTEEMFDEWSADGVEFVCRDCAYDATGEYDFERSLLHLRTNPDSAKGEALLLTTYNVKLPVLRDDATLIDWSSDKVAKQVLAKFHPIILNTHRPLAIGGDGNCLYRALSAGLYGTERYHLHVRLITALEMITFPDEYNIHSVNYTGKLAGDAAFVESYADELGAVCAPGRWSGLIHLYAASAALRVPLRSYCPPILHTEYLSMPLTRVIHGRGVSTKHHPEITIMWTSSSVPASQDDFRPDHFAVLIKNQVTVMRGNINHTCQDTLPDTVTTDPPISPQQTSANPDDVPEPTLPETTDASCDTAPGGTPLPNEKFLDAPKVIKLLHSEDPSTSSIPNGRKENTYFIVDNQGNVQRRNEGKKSIFDDDCGAWVKGTSPVTVMSQEGTQLKFCDGLYCVRKYINGKLTYQPLHPQPEETVTLQRYYTTLKADNSYKRRVSWVQERPHVALVEYVGKFPGRTPHGNSTSSGRNYIRTKPHVLEKIEQLATLGNPKAIYEEIIREAPREQDKPSDLRQVQNKLHKANTRREDVNSGGSNLAANFNYLQSQIHYSNFVRKITHEKGKVPTIICYTDSQILDLKRFCCTSPVAQSTVLGVDKTYNLGQCHVTTMVFKNLSVIRNGTNNNPVFLGPIIIHGNSDWQTFASFFSTIAMELTGSLSQPVIGSDEERAIRKAAKFSFPEAKLISCQRHLKQNVTMHLRDKIGLSMDERNKLVSLIFGKDGLTDSLSWPMFEKRKEEVVAFIQNSVPGFGIYFEEHILPILKDNHDTIMSRPGVGHGWTNNNCESLNHILKLRTGWRQQDIPKLIDSLEKLVSHCYEDVERSFIQRGEFKLSEEYKDFHVEFNEWEKKSSQQRQRHLKKFLSTPKILKPMVSSENLFVLQAPLRGKKPCQRKRSRATRTTTLK